MRASILALVVVVAVVVAAAAAAAAGLGFPLRVLVCWKHPREWRNEGMEERRNEGKREKERKKMLGEEKRLCGFLFPRPTPIDDGFHISGVVI